MMVLLPILLLVSSSAWAASSSNLCDILDLKNCAGVSKQGRRASLPSLPSPSTAASLNPATVSFDRGLGIEMIHQSGNSLLFNLASGNGRVGGALVNASLENSFFGNRTYELDSQYLKRNKEKKQYKSKKLNLALGGKLFQKKNASLDMGILLKRHSEIKRINPGIGASARWGFLTLGASTYQDDFHLDLVNNIDPYTGLPYAAAYNKTEYTERFVVSTYSIGARIKSLALDYGVIKTRYDRDEMNTEAQLYSSSYIYGDFMFNLAYRIETSPAPKYIDGALKLKESKKDIFAGVQASLGKYVIVGVNYNYFLLREFSLLATVFF